MLMAEGYGDIHVMMTRLLVLYGRYDDIPLDDSMM